MLASLTIASWLALLGESVSIGTPAKGSLKDGVSFESQGDGFVTYSALGAFMGRRMCTPECTQRW